jgi:hypothetical protein
MSYQQSLKANHRFLRRVSKDDVLKSPSATPARVAIPQEGILGQSVRRLATFVTTRKKTAACVLAIVGGLSWFMAPLGRDTTLADFLGEEGYWETDPPADYYLPGTINTIEVRSDGRVAIHPTCKIDPELLSNLTLQSHTIDRTFAERLSKKFAVADWVKELLPIEMKGDKAKTFNLSLRNSTILQITDEELLLVQRTVVKDSCREAIEISIHSGATVCQTRAAIKGDLVYDTTYEKHGSVQIKDPGSSDLQLEPKQENTDRVVGQGLIYGVNFASLGIVFNTTPDAKPPYPNGISGTAADCRVGSEKNVRNDIRT